MKSVHVVFPSEKQAYNVRHARHPHYQSMFYSILEYISKPLEGDFEVVFCWPNEDHETEEISVVNGDAVSKFVDAIDWRSIQRRIQIDSKKIDPTAGGATRQSPGNAVDYGFTTSQSTSRKNSESGHSKPAMKKNTELEEIKLSFVTLSNLAQDFKPRWRPGGVPFEYMSDHTRSQFSKLIHEDNFMESLHPAITSIDAQCGCHNDNHVNSNLLSDVYCISKIINNQRISINAQQRKSVDDFHLRTSDQGELLYALEKYYDSIPNERRVIGKHLNETPTVTFVPGFPSIKNCCNLDPLSYSLPVVDFCARLAIKFRLNTLELLSLQVAAQVIPNTTLFHSVACRAILEMPPEKVPSHFRKGFGFGYFVMRVMVDEFTDYRDSGRPQTFLRYNSYRLPVVPTSQQWEERCALTMMFCLHVFSVYPNPSSAKNRGGHYASICNRLGEMWEGFGTLGATHSILQKCLLGLLPLWCLEYAVIAPDARSIKFFNNEFPMQKKIKGQEIDRFCRTVSSRFQTKYNVPFSLRLLENFFCKAYREFTKLLDKSGCVKKAVDMIGQESGGVGNQRFCDLLVPGQLLFTSTRLGLRVIYPDGSSQTLESMCVFERMPFGSELLKMEAIAKLLSLSKMSIPSDTKMLAMTLDRRMVSPTQSLQVDFRFPGLPALDDTGNRRARMAITKYISGFNPIPRTKVSRSRTAIV